MAEARVEVPTGHDGFDARTSLATRTLATFAASTTYADIPAAVLRESKRCILDYLAVAIGAADEPAPCIALDQVRDLGGRPQASVLVHGDRTSIPHAALVNGVMSHVFDFDDTHIPTVLHATGPIASAGLAVAEARHATGRDLVAAHAVAFDVAARIALALSHAHYEAGWHMTGTAGTLGAAAAVGHLLGLTAERTVQALGIAATQAGGHREQFGTMTKSFHSGKAASNGSLAALLAERGYGAAPDSLEGRRGMFHVMSSHTELERLTDGLGEEWEIFRNGLKPYACGVVSHAGIDAIRQLRAQVREPEIAEIELRVHPLVLELTAKPTPMTGLEGKFSIAFAGAIAFLDGTAGERQFTDANVRRPDVISLGNRIVPVADPSLSNVQAAAIARLHDGRELTCEVAVAPGTPGNPLTDEGLQAKVVDLVDPVLGRGVGERLCAMVHRLDELDSLTPLLELARRGH